MTDTPVWRSWKSIVERCTVPTSKAWPSYGGRGVTVCDRWLAFENFYADMGDRPPGASIDRIDNSKGYTPTNCRWATPKQQANNRRSNTRITLDGETKTMREWSEYFGIKYATVKTRYATGIRGNALFAASPRREYGRRVLYGGELVTITQLARRLGVPYKTAWTQVNKI